MIVAVASLRVETYERPTCLCGATMKLARIEPHPTVQHADIRTFECTSCGHSLRQTFGEND